MHIHILGICGTFMGGIAALASALGHKVTGSDKNVYPPMSTQLEKLGIGLTTGYDPEQLDPLPDIVIIGNAMSRGNPAVEAVLARKIPYTSGPQWLLENLLKDKWVLAVAGTHGKTSTASMLAWVLEYAGMQPGFLIGGVPENFAISARAGDSAFFVIEADEYDTAFFDKRSKFVHYRPNTLIFNNLEFDHADIFEDLAAIQKQFHHLIRMIPGNGLILKPSQVPAIETTLDMGCWTEQQTIGDDWQANLLSADGSKFEVLFRQEKVATVNWSLIGNHNVHNALMTIAAARNVGVTPDTSAEALASFKNVKRRMELKGEASGIKVYDDFAHHPTAIETTLAGLRANVGKERILAILEPRSNTMKMGIHKSELIQSLQGADEIYLLQPENISWQLTEFAVESHKPIHIFDDLAAMISHISESADVGDHLLVMSNGGFGGIHDKLLANLQHK
ncbi:UDP-N-acetylmuramate:L-alanyl-gamma-D-glutamyl-meso-diaminopimelate ligase [Planctobacterium marinum]|uniref:UDP-N-acetylmuramate:L-alanyl-gamma-D-glutamyl- meso-diaminopimelate ligase n=1 Tax=Planctobacterium marinum TaxID=1631968 RepID=UPI001E4432D5|nr:UDP-N-acetylmuramate:L-alanyl-gamma-D-glutamyl-meso-diaminopimelate ligase [Planctobacterium marinum]MCC2607687.1 UDP-N-acetylmuramate:L-alanyl-gamma-D-glutamyl-meso-diaminopimelate ligase [Planctobacterium marinum]